MRSVQFMLLPLLLANLQLSSISCTNDIQISTMKRSTDEFLSNLQHKLDMSSMKTMEEFNAPPDSNLENER